MYEVERVTVRVMISAVFFDDLFGDDLAREFGQDFSNIFRTDEYTPNFR